MRSTDAKVPILNYPAPTTAARRSSLPASSGLFPGKDHGERCRGCRNSAACPYPAGVPAIGPAQARRRAGPDRPPPSRPSRRATLPVSLQWRESREDGDGQESSLRNPTAGFRFHSFSLLPFQTAATAQNKDLLRCECQKKVSLDGEPVNQFGQRRDHHIVFVRPNFLYLTISNLSESMSIQSFPLPKMKKAVWKSSVSSGMSHVTECDAQSVVPLICVRPNALCLASVWPAAPLGSKLRPALPGIFSDLAQTVMRTVWPRYFLNFPSSRLCWPHHTNEY